MIKEKIEQSLKSEFAQQISKEQDFFFQKGQDALQKWLNFFVSDKDKADLEKMASDYDGLQALANQRATINEILNLLFEIISYCDSKAKDKAIHNQYNDKRTLAKANVRMNHWIEQLINFKFSPNNVPVGSILNAINYLLYPENNATILSENHREMISKALFVKEYVPNDFIKELKQYFSSYQIVVSNSKNYTCLLSSIIYSIKKEWIDDIIGLMASDNTLWKDELINDMPGDDCAILWNSKRPTGTNNTLKMLRNKINNDEYFKLFYSVHGKIQYVAEIIDFVENDNQLKKKNWPSEFKKIAWYQNDFDKYKDDNKSASIVFLAKKFYKINAIPATDFEVYKNYSYPTQDNLTPIVSEPDMTIISPPTAPLTTIDMRNNDTNSLNQILYGPPGTGKTYNTINKALEIINEEEEKKLNWTDRKAVKSLFDKRVDESRIVFTTFHQSMSYEDFIEGIKPRTKNENVTYAIEDGIFKSLVKKALIEYIRKDTDIDEATEFDTLYNDFVKSIKPLEGKRQGTFTTKTGVEIMLVEANNTSILVKYVWSNNNKKDVEGQHTFSVTKEKLKKVLLEGIEPAKIKSLKAELHPLIGHIHCELFAVYKNFYEFVIANKGEIETIHFDYEELSFEEVKEQFDLLSKEEINAKKVKPYIIIIDEINRGNVSQIFGELITLIEDDKRLGEDEALEVMLPYSKAKFGVPPNLYIVGTMNTADRSVEALDTALRRRFCFEEIEPTPTLIATKEKLYESNGELDSINLPRVLETINNRIEILSNRDHKIGHSYFMKVESVEGLRDTFKKNIIPLLQEYFYNDYEKIGWVLGEGFFEEKKLEKKTIFTKFFKQPKPEFELGYQLADIDKIDIKKAMLQLLGDYKEETQAENSEN